MLNIIEVNMSEEQAVVEETTTADTLLDNAAPER